MLDEPGTVADNAERNRLISPLRALSNADVMQARPVQGILYIESCTNLDILRAWAALPGHRAEALLATEVMWKPAILQARDGGADNAASGHAIISRPCNWNAGNCPGLNFSTRMPIRAFRRARLPARACNDCGGDTMRSRANCCIRIRLSGSWNAWSAALPPGRISWKCPPIGRMRSHRRWSGNRSVIMSSCTQRELAPVYSRRCLRRLELAIFPASATTKLLKRCYRKTSSGDCRETRCDLSRVRILAVSVQEGSGPALDSPPAKPGLRHFRIRVASCCRARGCFPAFLTV